MTDHVVLEFPSSYKYLNMIDLVCSDFVENMGFTEELKNEISISVIEACTNALEHGNKCCPNENVRVIFSQGEGSMIIEVFDKGEGFDFEGYLQHIPNPSNVNKYRGRGIYIMNSMMDKLEFEVMPDRGMKVKLVKFLPKEN